MVPELVRVVYLMKQKNVGSKLEGENRPLAYRY